MSAVFFALAILIMVGSRVTYVFVPVSMPKIIHSWTAPSVNTITDSDSSNGEPVSAFGSPSPVRDDDAVGSPESNRNITDVRASLIHSSWNNRDVERDLSSSANTAYPITIIDTNLGADRGGLELGESPKETFTPPLEQLSPPGYLANRLNLTPVRQPDTTENMPLPCASRSASASRPNIEESEISNRNRDDISSVARNLTASMTDTNLQDDNNQGVIESDAQNVNKSHALDEDSFTLPQDRDSPQLDVKSPQSPEMKFPGFIEVGEEMGDKNLVSPGDDATDTPNINHDDGSVLPFSANASSKT